MPELISHQELNDAQVIRNRLWNMSIWSKIVTQQEASQAAPHLHSVVVVGAGATGVEVAGALSDSSAFLRTVGKGGKGDTGKVPPPYFAHLISVKFQS